MDKRINKTNIVNVRLREDVLMALDIAARMDLRTRSSFVENCIVTYLSSLSPDRVTAYKQFSEIWVSNEKIKDM